jgi:hypothetical protein
VEWLQAELFEVVRLYKKNRGWQNHFYMV